MSVPDPALAQWRALALGVLRKAGRASETDDPAVVDRLLSSTTYDGITVAPLYPAGAAGSRVTRAAGRWDVRALHTDPDAAATNAAIHDDLAGGVTSLWLRGVDDLSTALAGVDLTRVPVVLDGSPALLDRGATVGNLGFDPLGLCARTGTTADLTPAVRAATRCAGTGVRAITVDATVVADAGGSDGQELGVSLAAGVAYLRALTEAGLDVNAAADQLEFRFAATVDQFATIATLRAARRLWARVLELCEAAPTPQRQHAVTSAAMMTARDPWVNPLRTTVAAFAAGVGGADAVTVLPFDTAVGRPDARGRRLARNTQALLLLESHLGEVTDAAAGSGYVESLTDALVGVAWDWFTEIERAGGLAAALASGLVAQRLATTWAARERALRRRTDPLTGVSEFPNLDEARLVREPASPPTAADGGLPRHRYAEQFEALRDAADATLPRPTVFLATLGSVAAHAARAAFATNLLAAGGVATVAGPADADTDPARVAAAFAASGLRVAVIAGTDRAYAERAEAVAKALAAAGARAIWLAGRGPVDGVTGYLFTGVDAIEVLSSVHAQLGVAA